MKINQQLIGSAVVALFACIMYAAPACATPFLFSTGNPDGLMGTLSRTGTSGSLQTETADDFVLPSATTLSSATFTGLLPTGTPLSSVARVEVEFYHVFPVDSTSPPSGHVPTRVNSPGDVEIGTATRDSVGGSLTFITTFLNTSFTVNNSVVNGIHPMPNQTTNGEGPVTGEEVLFSVAFNPGIVLPADHYFFRPEVQLTNGNFLWLSAPRPIVNPGTPFPAGSTDLQAWIRNDALAPDWLRIGADVVGGTTPPAFNATFTLSGEAVPEPSGAWVVSSGLAVLLISRVGRFRQWWAHNHESSWQLA